MTEIAPQPETTEGPQAITMAEFLESTPPSQLTTVSDMAYPENRGHKEDRYLSSPDIKIHCETCAGIRYFRPESDYHKSVPVGRFEHNFLEYRCSNCQKTLKIYSLAFTGDKNSSTHGQCYKYGEMPPYGPLTPARLVHLLGPDKELFLRGRRCEIQGLGIGAFGYYRRVVQQQKNRILDEIIKVSEKIGAPKETVAALQAAKTGWHFTESVESVQDAIPESLLIKGNNPLLLLHKALSQGLHDLTDEECLSLASSIRLVLGDLAERLATALHEDKELNAAISKLLAKKKGTA